MSIRPASSWPWLDDALVDAGAFVEAGDDLVVAAGGTDDPGSSIDWSLAAVDIGDPGDPGDDLWDTSDTSGPTAPLSLASDHDPFHFEPAPDSAIAEDPAGDLHGGFDEAIVSALRDAIESAPGFVVDDPALVGDRPLDDRGIDAMLSPGATGFPDLDPAPSDDPAGHLFGAVDPLDPVDPDDPAGDLDPGGDLDDFDGVDSLDDVDGL